MLLKAKKNLFIGMNPFQIYKIDDSILLPGDLVTIERKDIFLLLEEMFSSFHNRYIIKVLHNNQMYWAFKDYFEAVEDK
jgi:hypothetical protein